MHTHPSLTFIDKTTTHQSDITTNSTNHQQVNDKVEHGLGNGLEQQRFFEFLCAEAEEILRKIKVTTREVTTTKAQRANEESVSEYISYLMNLYSSTS